MVKYTPQQVLELSNSLFERQYPMLSLYQTIADNFYPQRADFVFTRNIGSELASGLVDSYPILVQRDLGNSLSAMLRSGTWFEMGINQKPDHEGRRWLQDGTSRLTSLIRDRKSNFVRATREGDHDYTAFGQCVISIELRKLADGLLYRTWHLRDCAWFDNEEGAVGGVTRKWTATLRQAVDYFGEQNMDPSLTRDLYKTPFKEVEFRHVVIPSTMYGDEQYLRYPFVSMWIDVKNVKVVEVRGSVNRIYCVPRFQTISGSPYAYSPATVIGLPNARVLQAMTHTLMEAAERYARPPIIATMKAIRGDVDLSPDGITWADDQYDERMGAALRTLQQDKSGFPIGANARERVDEVLASAFFLDKLSLPDLSHEMTAYEVSERTKQFRREATPLFDPIEFDYSGQLCEMSFEVAMAAGFLGSPYDIPMSLRGSDVEFKFKSPLTESDDEKKSNRFTQMSRLLSETIALDESVVDNVDFDTAVRDAIEGYGAPQTWLVTPELRDLARQARMKQQASQTQMAIEQQQ